MPINEESDTYKHNMLAIDLNCVYITQATKQYTNYLASKSILTF